jgi:hypothetical protein
MLNFNSFLKTVFPTFDFHQTSSDFYPVKKVFDLLICQTKVTLRKFVQGVGDAKAKNEGDARSVALDRV